MRHLRAKPVINKQLYAREAVEVWSSDGKNLPSFVSESPSKASPRSPYRNTTASATVMTGGV